MDNRWLAPRAMALGLVVGIVVFLTLHLALDASVLGSLAWLLVGGAITTALVLHVRRVELLRTRQAQGYFVSAMMVAGITLAWLPPGTIGDALGPGRGQAPIEDVAQNDEAAGSATGVYPNASAAVAELVDAAKADFPLSDTTVQSITISPSMVIVAVYDPTADLVRAYSMDGAGNVYDPSQSNAGPYAIHEFALSAIKVPDLNELYDAVASSSDVTPSAEDTMGIIASTEGAAPYITVSFGPPQTRTVVYTDAVGALQDGPG